MNAQYLKNSILQLAIQGKLVEQLAEEGTAKELLEKIELEKKRLIKEGKIKKQKTLPQIKEDEIPFDIPEGWEWVRIGTVCNVINGFTPSKSNPKFWSNGTIPWFTIADVRSQGRFINFTEQSITEQAISKSSDRIIPKDSILLCCTASVGEYAYTNIPLTTNQQFNGLVIKDEYKKLVYPMYIYEFAKTLKRTLLLQAGKTTINFVSVKKVSNIVVPLPPLEEQKRIVAKIEELMPYVDKYDVAYSEVEELNKKFPEDIQKSILQYAIQGKLVEQREEDGTAEDLYKQIQEEKKKLIKEGKIKKTKALPEITEDEIPFDIPENWKWVRLGDLLYKLTDGTHSTPKYTATGVPFISVKDISSGEIDFSNTKFISREEHEALYKRCDPERDDILLTKVGTTGIPVIVDTDKEFSLFVSVALLKFNTDLIFNKYFMYVIKAPVVQIQARENTRGVGNKNWVMRDIANTVLPLSPLAEQKRIVEKIEELLPYTNQLIKKVD
ncbi:restriction endonuclease subunit S [Enterococcus lactis]|uniref:restriction endonuclease subunit S n=1 Tax=Enterococcus lactis TaxID=357441 RepID=UPI0037701E1F|nr:restriction endonuclease subunit S [Enterococcus faecium]